MAGMFVEVVVEQLDERDGLACAGCGDHSAVATDYAVTKGGVTSVGRIVSCEECGHFEP